MPGTAERGLAWGGLPATRIPSVNIKSESAAVALSRDRLQGGVIQAEMSRLG
jgi:hypothetical protein